MKDLAEHSLYSIVRIVTGGGFAVIAGTILGIIIGYFKTFRLILIPVVYVAAPVPKVALMPLIMMLFGIGEFAKVFIIFIVILLQIILYMSGAVTRIPKEYFVPLRAAKASHAFIVRHVVLPACLSELFTAIRTGLATAISVLFFAEAFGTRFGLGFYVMDRWSRLDYPGMAMGIIMTALVGLISAIIVDVAEKCVCGWRK